MEATDPMALTRRITQQDWEGLAAYAEEHITLEGTIAWVWQVKWQAIQDGAAPIIEGNTPDDCDRESYVGQVETIKVFVQDDNEDGYNLDIDF